MHARAIGQSLLWVCALGCQPAPGPDAAEPLPPGMNVPAPTASAPVPDAKPLSLMTWNVEWFQDPGEGPSDDPLQFERVLDVLRRTDADLIAVQEIAAPLAFERIAAALPRHGGVLSEYRWTQKLGLLYHESRVRVRSVGAIEGLDDAGRPPLDVRLELLPEAAPLRVVVVHAKASADTESRATRARFAAELARRLRPASRARSPCRAPDGRTGR
jgi:endonuclease/exonuclease/phosphatase family metal-dependent hydrolase